MKSILRLAAMGGRIGQRRDDLEELDHRAWPAMGDDDRQGVRVRRADVQEVDVEAVDPVRYCAKPLSIASQRRQS